MIVLDGQPALSPFRLERLNAALAEAGVLRVASAHWRYFAAAALVPDADARLAEILDGNPAAPARADTLLVLPRLGTRSPWSSKASEIAEGCGLGPARIERGMAIELAQGSVAEALASRAIARRLHDPMTQSLLAGDADLGALFAPHARLPLRRIALGADAEAALRSADRSLGLALSADEIAYLAASYRDLGRDPTDAELMMFAQANSEHCRHKVFNASWRIDGAAQAHTLFEMIKATHRATPAHTLSAYSDNAAVIEGSEAQAFAPDPDTRRWRIGRELVHFAIKVETHNHPTAIAPFPGASTGSGGEIRDEGATGRGGKPKAGLTGFSVSHLRIPGLARPWETPRSLPPRFASAFEIMRDGPLGAAAFNNEFGRPALLGYFRSFEHTVGPGETRGYDKPIMLAGGLANLRAQHVHKGRLAPGDIVIVLGGPALLIGLGGGAASSLGAGASSEELDFASVQRDNPEMQRRCQEVIDQCRALGESSPIIAIHDVGAGGLSNALPELLNDSGLGGRIELREIPSDDPQLSPMQIWCNEAQERYVLGLRPDRLEQFAALCARERCPYAAVGVATVERRLLVGDRLTGEAVVDMPLEVLLGKPPRMQRDTERRDAGLTARFDAAALDTGTALERVLRHPTVGSKSFLITIGDRSVGGLCARDPMVGPWQTPVADCALTLVDFEGYAGEAMAIGERTPLALLSPAAAARLAVGEALTNLLAAPVAALDEIKLSANWMAAVGSHGEDAALFDAVRAIGLDLCPALSLSIPVGKDSLSMQVNWREGDATHRTVAPVSPVISAFARVADVRAALTPELRLDAGESELWLIDLGAGRDRLGGSILAQCHGTLGAEAPDLDEPARVVSLFRAFSDLKRAGLVLACHDRSDGGLIVAALEMAFAARSGLVLELDRRESANAALFNEELGLLFQIRCADRERMRSVFAQHGLEALVRRVGAPLPRGRDAALRVYESGRLVLERPMRDLLLTWHETSHAMQRRRDNPECADAEREALSDYASAGLAPRLTFDPASDVAAPYVARGARPAVAILREQGVNGQVEMAAAFTRAGFDADDVHMSDLIAGRVRLDRYLGFVACGGFSYGDVLGAGRGWATSIRYRPELADQFQRFLADSGRFALGVCNGCQMMAALKAIVPGASAWPRLERNRSEQYEARLAQVEILDSPSLFFTGMAGSRIPVVVAHGEGRAVFERPEHAAVVPACARFVDGEGVATEHFPANPNGSPGGLTAFTNVDGRVTILMPHPERVFRSVQMSWRPQPWGEDSPWMRMFRNARVWVGS
jgi:phosphoribosylformylglycinamidine synthase